ncbi:MAG: hypothetical protein NZ961_10335 [Candidatus Poribacteria bacterium]|nr:hypothetical protein [Candidatus Poribacteria bacterium]
MSDDSNYGTLSSSHDVSLGDGDLDAFATNWVDQGNKGGNFT